jgi:RNA polymerase sigma factor (sigma-70 family)
MSKKTSAERIADRGEFANVYNEVHDRLLARLTGMVRDRQRAEDLAAVAFQRGWEKREQFRGESSPATWLHAIGFNEARRSRRRERRIQIGSVEHLETMHHAESGADLDRDELRAKVREALARVPAAYRRILIARYIEDRPVREIAKREHIPLGTVGSRLFAARRMLREAWQDKPAATVPPDVGQDKAQEIAEEALKRLAEELQAGRSEALKAYLAAMGRFHRYSWNNAILIQSQRPTATRVAGYHAWHQLGRFVKRGEKGIAILAPIRIKAPEPTASLDPGQVERTSRLVGFRTAYVFDVEQTEGRPLPQFATTTGDPSEYADRLKAFVARRGIALKYDPSIAPAQGQSSGGLIQLRPGMAPAEEFSVLAHELAHEMLHHGQRDARLPKQVVETQAEAVAFVVCRGVGLETGTAAADYITLYNADKKTLAESLAVIQETSSQILKELLPDERTPAPEKAFDGQSRQIPAPQPSADDSPSLHRPAAPPAPDPGESPSFDR